MRVITVIRDGDDGLEHVAEDCGMSPPLTRCGLTLNTDTVVVSHAQVTAARIITMTCPACHALAASLHNELRARDERRKRAAGGRKK